MKKLNIIDIFIIMFAVLTLLGVGIRTAANFYLNEKNNTEYLVSVKISSVDLAKENAIAVNDEVRIADLVETFGSIYSVEVVDYIPGSDSENSGVVMDDIKCNIICKIIVKGTQTDTGFLHESGKYLYAGTELEIKTAGYEGLCLIVDIINKNQ